MRSYSAPLRRRARYRDGVEFIALNDEPLDTDVDSIGGYVTVVMLAVLFGTTPERVAHDVQALRLERDMPTRSGVRHG